MYIRTLKVSLAAAAALGILFFSLVPDPPDSPVAFPFLDKIEHAAAYALLGYLILEALHQPDSRSSRSSLLLTVIICSVMGGAVEILQGFTGRTPDFVDFLADILGVCAGVAVWIGVRKISR